MGDPVVLDMSRDEVEKIKLSMKESYDRFHDRCETHPCEISRCGGVVYTHVPGGGAGQAGNSTYVHPYGHFNFEWQYDGQKWYVNTPNEAGVWSYIEVGE